MITSAYQQMICDKIIESTPAQAEIVDRLADFARTLQHYEQKFNWWRPRPGLGLYFYGGTGRGKTMLMNLFFDNINIKAKLKIHFFEFMLNFHRDFAEIQQAKDGDPFDKMVKNIAQKYKLICFDEFHIVNIATAMILARLIKSLSEQGVHFIFTSNFAPDELYKDGLQRAQFVPFIDFVCQNFTIIHFDGAVDYRFLTIAQGDHYLCPNSPENNQKCADYFAMLVGDNQITPYTLLVDGHQHIFAQASGRILMCDFAELCQRLLWTADYIALSERFELILITNVPCFTADNLNEMRRFITMIDVFYEKNLKLILTAQAPVDQLLQTHQQSQEFARTHSRLNVLYS